MRETDKLNETTTNYGNPASLKGKLQSLEVSQWIIAATNPKYFQWTQQPQEGSPGAKEREGYPRVCAHNEDVGR